MSTIQQIQVKTSKAENRLLLLAATLQTIGALIGAPSFIKWCGDIFASFWESHSSDIALSLICASFVISFLVLAKNIKNLFFTILLLMLVFGAFLYALEHHHLEPAQELFNYKISYYYCSFYVGVCGLLLAFFSRPHIEKNTFDFLIIASIFVIGDSADIIRSYLSIDVYYHTLKCLLPLPFIDCKSIKNGVILLCALILCVLGLKFKSRNLIAFFFLCAITPFTFMVLKAVPLVIGGIILVTVSILTIGCAQVAYVVLIKDEKNDKRPLPLNCRKFYFITATLIGFMLIYSSLVYKKVISERINTQLLHEQIRKNAVHF